MKIRKICLYGLMLVPMVSIGDDSKEGIKIVDSEYSYLTITNVTEQVVDVAVFSNEYVIEPHSGLSIFCENTGFIQLEVTNDSVTEYIEAPCTSAITIN